MIINGRGGAEVWSRSLVKIIIRESMCQGVMDVQVHRSSQCRVRESSLCPSACLCEDPLQLKRITSCCCPVLGATEGLDERMTMLHIVGQGPVKGSLLNEDLSLHGTMWSSSLACIALGVADGVRLAA
jgi:hypothetical protein